MSEGAYDIDPFVQFCGLNNRLGGIKRNRNNHVLPLFDTIKNPNHQTSGQI